MSGKRGERTVKRRRAILGGYCARRALTIVVDDGAPWIPRSFARRGQVGEEGAEALANCYSRVVRLKEK